MDDGELVRVLKDGYWERTSVVRKPGGELRVRKENRGGHVGERPWARRSLVREIRYLRTLPAEAAALFPEVSESWGVDREEGPVGYEMAYLEGWSDLGTLVQSDAEHFDEAAIAEAVIGTLHVDANPYESLATHVAEVMEIACSELAQKPAFAALIDAEQVMINGAPVRGVRRSISEAGHLLHRLDAAPQVRLHGDLILENVIASEDRGDDRWLLIDPVSVAGVTVGHPLFDLVKYRSYASGELFAIRSGAIVGRARSANDFELSLGADERLKEANLGGAFRSRYVERYGEPDEALTYLLDGYFSLAMAINTTGSQPITRALKAALSLGAIK